MRHCGYRSLLRSGYTLLAIALGLMSWSVQAASSSALSRWLSREAVPEIRELLRQHPRYQGQRVKLVSDSRNALAEAVATVVNGALVQDADIRLVLDEPMVLPRIPVPGSIDDVDCHSSPPFEYLLQLSAASVNAGQGQVRLVLLDVAGASGASGQNRSWQWQGVLSSAERRSLKKPATLATSDGSVTSPWRDQDVDRAATALSNELACALRPQLVNHLKLHWPPLETLPGLFADTANSSRHLLGSYRELSLSGEQHDYQVDIRLERFRHDTWQLWLIGTPQHEGLAPVQAVTYINTQGVDWPLPPLASARVEKSVATPSPERGKPDDYLAVEMLGATRTDRGPSSAELQITVRIGNRSTWPIAYAFSASGGHFNDCIARLDNYRHDGYGRLSGSIAAGQTEVRRLIIKNAQHRPTPWFGMRKCAGFRDLEGFEAFASQGHKVTDFVRWDL
jgi:hypothetical protein